MYAFELINNSDSCPKSFTTWTLILVLISRPNIDFLLGFDFKSVLELDMNADSLRRCAHYGEDSLLPQM